MNLIKNIPNGSKSCDEKPRNDGQLKILGHQRIECFINYWNWAKKDRVGLVLLHQIALCENYSFTTCQLVSSAVPLPILQRLWFFHQKRRYL